MSIHARIPIVVSVIAVCLLTIGVGDSWAQRRARKPKPACGITILPFIQGYEWTYEAVAPPEETGARKVAANKPLQPPKVIIKVLSVQINEDKVTEITVEETAHDITKNLKFTCTKDGLDIHPNSFFFVGEPGGGLALEISDLQRQEDEHSYVTRAGTLRLGEWIVNLKASFKRFPSEGSGIELAPGTLDIQRIAKLALPEEITTAMGTFKTQPIQFELAGSVILDTQPEKEQYGIPANTFSKVWLADNVGIVQAFNSNGHMYHLTDAKLGEEPPQQQQPK